MNAEIAPVVQVPVERPPVPAPPSADTDTASSTVQWQRARSTLQRNAVHEAAAVLLGETQAREQVSLGAQHFKQLLEKAVAAARREAQAEHIETQQDVQLEVLQAQQASQLLQRRTSPVDPDLLRLQTDTLARTM